MTSDAIPEGTAGTEPEERAGSARAHRRAKVAALRAAGQDPYPPRFARDRTLAELRDTFGHLGAGTETDERVSVAGRLMLLRRHGGLSFAQIRDADGDVQLYVSRADLGDDGFARFNDLDLGDWAGATGTVMVTRRGELSVKVDHAELLSKALRPPPAKHGGLADVETRHRRRYLDLMSNESTRQVFRIRRAVIRAIREHLLARGYREVETQVLMSEATGAAARPFVTHHNALDTDMYMRIALELPLKRLIVGGLDRVFEINRVFRNEGLDTRHNPEFTLLEAYEAFSDYHDIMDLTETMVAAAAMAAIGTTRITAGAREIDLAPPWRRATMAELILENAGVEMHPAMPVDDARRVAARLGVPFEPAWGSGRIMAEVFDVSSEHLLVAPTFVMDHPLETSPLARVHRDDPALTERFEAYVAGRELANAYSELNDPVDQRERFLEEARMLAAGDEEAQAYDADFIAALEQGMPPTGGLGVGIDRLVMLIAGVDSIREVILFPTLRPEGGRRAAAPPAGNLPSPAELASPAVADAGEQAEAAGPASPASGGRMAGAFAHPWAVRLLCLATALLGVLTLVPGLPFIHWRGLGIEDTALSPDARALTQVGLMLCGLGLLCCVKPLARRKRRGLTVAVVLLVVAAALHLLRGPSIVAATLCLALAVALVLGRQLFVALPDPRSLGTALRFIPLYLGVVLVFGISALVVERNAVEPELSLGGMLQTIFAGLVGLDGPYTYRSEFFAEFFPDALLALGIAGVVIFAYLVFRPLTGAGRGGRADDRERAARLVRAYGDDTLSYFALREDKSYVFSSDGRAMVAYSYTSGYALASGDPVGPPDALGPVVDEFLAFCRARAWHVAFLAVREGDSALYRERGLRSVYLGDEAILRCDGFSLSGHSRKKVREAVNRVAKAHTFDILRESEAPETLVDQLNEISASWRGKKPERGFTMALGRDVTGAEPEFLLAVARREGEPVAFLRLVPVFGVDPGYSLDLMRRRPDAQNGVTEFLIAKTAVRLGERGFTRLSMNFATWGRLFHGDVRLSPVQRVARFWVDILNPFFQIRSLYEFSGRFDPEWLPRSIVVEDAAAAPRVGLLYARMEGFLNLPRIGRRLVPRAGQEDAPGPAVTRT